MTGTKLANRYARSLVLLAIERNELEQVNEDMKLISETCHANRELVVLLKSPVIKTDKKKAILHELFAAKIGKTTLAFMDIITSKRRESYIEKIAEEFTTQYKETNKITTAVITTTVPLDTPLKDKIMKLVKDKTKQEVELVERIDEKLVGGFILRIGDTQIDDSIQRKLVELKKNFRENPYVREF